MPLLDEVPADSWDAFLACVPESNIFQSRALHQVYEKTTGFRPFVFGSESKGEMNALVSGAIVSYGPRTLARFASRALVVGGPIGDELSFPLLLGALDEMARKSALLTQIRNLKVPSDRGTFESIGYRWEDHLNFIVNLDQSEESLSRSLSKGRRKAIEKADRSGLQLLEVRREQLPSAYELLEQAYSRAGIPLADRSLFENALKYLGTSAHLWVLWALSSGWLCALRFVLRWNTALFDWYAGSSDLGRALHADEWLVWQLFRKGIAAGSRAFDFGGAGTSGGDYGPGEFKRRFGGEIIVPGRFVKTYHPVVLRIARAIYPFWRDRRNA